jgi:hypothetical protein
MTTTVKPKIGMGATMGIGSDCYPYTIVEILSDKRIAVTADISTPTGKHDYFRNQDYDYTSNPDGVKEIYTLRKNGRWVREGETMHSGRCLHIGSRRRYDDPHF